MTAAWVIPLEILRRSCQERRLEGSLFWQLSTLGNFICVRRFGRGLDFSQDQGFARNRWSVIVG